MLKSDGKYHEKGVDVRIAVDILRGALKNEYRRCFVISSDTDLIPA
ncbi:helicase, partial [Candidatus Berkelbacteria bacterium CG_4_8_14_3_um_filter_33_6]